MKSEELQKKEYFEALNEELDFEMELEYDCLRDKEIDDAIDNYFS